MNHLYRHKVRGSTYELFGEAEMQLSKPTAGGQSGIPPYRKIREGDRLCVYQGKDGKLWARFPNEFHDGRFEDITPARRWWPDHYLDEVMPTGAYEPDGWLLGRVDDKWIIAPPDRDEAKDYGLFALAEGEEIGFSWHEPRGTAVITIQRDGSWRLAGADPEPDWTHVYAADDFLHSANSLEEFAQITAVEESYFDGDDQAVFDLVFGKWGDARFRLKITGGEPSFEPVEAGEGGDA